MNMRKIMRVGLLDAVMVATGAEMVGAFSEPVSVNTPLEHNRRWMTVYTNEIPLAWEWNTNAASARLNIAGMNRTVTTNFASATSNWVWHAFAPGVPSAEDVYDLTLTFYRDTAVIGALTSRLAVITGAFGTAAVYPGSESGKWGKVGKNAVIPYDADWTNATAGSATGRLMITKTDGSTKTNTLAEASGYFGWDLTGDGWGYGIFNLSLTFPPMGTNTWDARLMRPMDGTIIRMQ